MTWLIRAISAQAMVSLLVRTQQQLSEGNGMGGEGGGIRINSARCVSFGKADIDLPVHVCDPCIMHHHDIESSRRIDNQPGVRNRRSGPREHARRGNADWPGAWLCGGVVAWRLAR